ncbi:MAG: UPF0016 family protein [Clostridia bacterium]
MDKLIGGKNRKKGLLFWGAVGYVVALITSPFLPGFVSLFIPVVTIVIASKAKMLEAGSVPIESRQRSTVDSIPESAAPVPAVSETPAPAPAPVPEATMVSPYFQQTLEYLSVLQAMIIAENQNNNLDDEITDKTLNIISKVQTILPFIDEMNIAQTKHEVRSIVLKDLNSVINPFLKLNVQNKLNNRRKLLEGLKDINQRLKQISATIEQQDIYELDRKLELISVKYRNNEIY